MQQPTEVDFHFDVMCPYAYQTSLWMREVRDRAGVDVTWRFFSLEEVNRAEGKKHNAAVICLARRRCDVILAMLRNLEPYRAPNTPAAETAPIAA